MYRDQFVLWSPFTHAIRKSKSYTAFKLLRGLSFQQFLSSNEVASTKRQKQLPADFSEKYVITMQRIPDALRETKQQAKCGSTPLAVVHRSVEELNSCELRGSVTVFDELGCQLTLDKTNG
jgi:hypothetical protein